MRVLLVDNAAESSRAASLALQEAVTAIDHVGSGRAALQLLGRGGFDAAVMGLELPDMPGSEVIRRMRSAYLDLPVLVMASRGPAQATVEAMRAGAGDFIMAPFDATELVARLETLVQRSRGREKGSLRAGPVQLRLDSREALAHGRPVRLTAKEFDCLELLVARKNQTVTKAMFLNDLYSGENEPEMKIIDVFVCKLRRKLADAGVGNLIATVWGRGYILREPVFAGDDDGLRRS